MFRTYYPQPSADTEEEKYFQESITFLIAWYQVV